MRNLAKVIKASLDSKKQSIFTSFPVPKNMLEPSQSGPNPTKLICNYLKTQETSQSSRAKP
jgi:hypothetical protein